MIVTDCRLRD